MAELVDAHDSKSCFARSESSILSSPTTFITTQQQFQLFIINFNITLSNNKLLKNIDGASKISFNQLSNRCEKQTKIIYRNSIK